MSCAPKIRYRAIIAVSLPQYHVDIEHTFAKADREVVILGHGNLKVDCKVFHTDIDFSVSKLELNLITNLQAWG